MGESWSDLDAVEYLHENGYVPTAGENPFAIGPYVTGDQQAGIRNYGMNNSPLNYSDVGYDFACNTTCPPLTQVHADGVHRPLRRRQRGGADRVRPGRAGRNVLPGQPALDPAGVRRLAADGHRRRQHGRRP